MTLRVAVVGGGVAGLAAARALLETDADVHVTLLEASERLGGNVRTHRERGFVVDEGPDSWVATRPHATRLAESLGLGPDLVGTRPDTRRVEVLTEGRLVPLPEGLVLGVPTRIGAMIRTELLSPFGKLRLALEPFVPALRFAPDEDVSVYDFLERRLGSEMTERLVAPLLSGIYAGDPTRLGVRTVAPQLVEATLAHGSLVAGALASLRARRATEPTEDDGSHRVGSTFLTLRRGLGHLVEALEARVRERGGVVRTSAPVERLERAEGGGIVVHAAGGPYAVDHVVLAAPAWVLAPLVRGLVPVAAPPLEAFEYASCATVFVGLPASAIPRPLDATGFIVPRSEGRPILAATYVSAKWDERAPPGTHLVRVFVGGAGRDRQVDESDETLVQVALDELEALVGLRRDDAPLLTRVCRFRRKSPQPTVGHHARMGAVRAALAADGRLHLAGTGYDGVGIPDAVRQAEAVAARLLRPAAA